MDSTRLKFSWAGPPLGEGQARGMHAWEAAHDRLYWGVGAGQRPLDPVWSWAAKAESGACADAVDSMGAAFVDVSAFYESFDQQVFLQEASATGLLLRLLRAALATYAAARYVKCGVFSAAPRFATRGSSRGAHWPQHW